MAFLSFFLVLFYSNLTYDDRLLETIVNLLACFSSHCTTPEKKKASPPITFTLSGRIIGSLRSTLSSLARNFALHRLSNRKYLRPFRKLSFPTSGWYTDGHQQRTVIG